MTAPPARAVTQRNPMFSKTEAEYNMKSIRFLLLTITTMFIVIGIIMMILGISVYGHYHSFAYFYESTKSGRFLTPSVLCVFIGLMLIVVSSFGFFGSLKQSTCMVNMYAMILLKILIFKLITIIMAFTTSSNTLLGYIYIPISQFPVDLEVQTEIQSLQNGLNCCGAESLIDYLGMDFPENIETLTVNMEIDGNPVYLAVPSSCCNRAMSGQCLNVRSTGCRQAIADVVVQNASVLGVLGVSVMFILLLGIIFALLLARCIRKVKSERAMMAWKIREQLIIASLEEDKRINILNNANNSTNNENRSNNNENTSNNNNTMYIAPTESSVA